MSTDPAAVSLDDKYSALSGRVLISGIQALVRLPLEQRRLDEARGLSTRAFVSGYQGSPLGGVDLEMGRAARFLGPAGVVFRPGLNEELAATAVAGTQMLGQLPGRRHEGVTGFWYGKNPGLDRAADAIRHSTVAGTAALGGAVAWIGDDPGAKSSTVPSSCEPMCQSLSMPLLAPSSIAEIIEFGLHAVAMSRASGLWTGLKIVADIADASQVIDLSTTIPGFPEVAAVPRGAHPTLVGPASLDAEHDMLTRRLDTARFYARQAGLNRITFSSSHATLGILASGSSYAVLLRALSDMGIDSDAMEHLGIRLIHLAMPYPLVDEELVGMTGDLEQVLVVEDKVPFLEGHLKQALYRLGGGPVVVGRHEENGKPLLSARGTLSAEDVAEALVQRIGSDRLPRQTMSRLAALSTVAPPTRIALPTSGTRTPFFCSGCPHSTSTRAADDTLVGVGIGCHIMIALDGTGRGHQVGLTQMGGEGAQWLGLQPFTDDQHFVQNLGDGTFHHSGSLAIRAAVAGGATMTYKLLYNEAVAMTGGQQVEGQLTIPDLTRWLALEGVSKVIVTTPDPRSYRRLRLDPIASVRHRDDLPDVERELAAVEGVSVLIHDDRCAAEERRLRKRGQLPTPTEKVVINQRVCEGCGDCGDVSACLSVQPVITEFGRKTEIHQPSCNSDFSCLKGDCPSFLLVDSKGGQRRPKRSVPDLPVVLSAPEACVNQDSVLLRMPGIGGTGVVTISQILQMAAHLDGRYAAGLEQTGLAQKGGPVVSDVRISTRPLEGALRASRATADVLLGFDVLGAATAGNLDTARFGHTVAVVNTAVVPTAAMVTNQVVFPGSAQDSLERIEAATRPADNLYLDAQRLSETLFDDHMPANMVLVGAAFQHGCIPLSERAIESAIRLNGAAVENNLTAFRWGRAAALAPQLVEQALASPDRPVVDITPVAHALIAPLNVTDSLREVLTLRAADLVAYQNVSYAAKFAADVVEIASLARQKAGEAAGERIALAYARSLHKLMAYKDEYEVARLHRDTVERAKIVDEFGHDADISVLLHPPLLRALGMKRKIRLRRTAVISFKALYALRILRGTRLDPFGYAAVRREERALVREFPALVREVMTCLTPDNAEAVREVVELPDTIRGYEEIKMARILEFRSRARAAQALLSASAAVSL
ncbi:indolepyruvate ferredoxin oxidoreductase family protein [Streptomyces chartreusis]|uniref:Indolepyruvate ferredoxin oxidoreductase family protein n=1 Tax=Streptomyces chartreusis TaxID=1969 RepID=A0A7H8T2A2_STRCX|nr:indolepyruvate ferredoxin oxidoreductase family protein [Streptomyces chartreusis]QKZ17587.1 indolepyruvate ferredoxin oxidoreductase family protein [Streptomyces chartreusis]